MNENTMQNSATAEQTDDFLAGWEEEAPLEGAGDGETAGKENTGDVENPGAEPEGAPAEGQGTNPDGQEPDAGTGGEGKPGGEPGGEEAQNQPETQQQPPPPKSWTLEHEGRYVTISEADVPELARKGLAFDRLQSAYDEARPVMELFRGFAQQAGLEVPEYVARIRAQAKQAQGMSPEEARRAVELEDRESRVSAQEEADRQRREAEQRNQEAIRQQKARVDADIREFMDVYPDAARDFQNIPKDVWDAVNGGMSLVAAYTRYQNTKTAEEQARQETVRKQNEENAARSAGSMRSAGSSHGPKDPFLEGWDED